MKSLLEFTKKADGDLPDIYCDMDQVLCNFMKGADAAVGGSFINTDKDERWNKINQTKNLKLVIRQNSNDFKTNLLF